MMTIVSGVNDLTIALVTTKRRNYLKQIDRQTHFSPFPGRHGAFRLTWDKLDKHEDTKGHSNISFTILICLKSQMLVLAMTS